MSLDFADCAKQVKNKAERNEATHEEEKLRKEAQHWNVKAGEAEREVEKLRKYCNANNLPEIRGTVLDTPTA